jgi:thiol-disulfide isomerase/thioredoxin
MNKVSNLFVFLFFSSVAFSQVKPLTIGDTIPDLDIVNIINYPEKSATTGQFKGKLLILDFWATWCSPCVAMLPKTDSLQKAFSDKVLFLPVTYQKRDEVISFLNKMKNATGLTIASVVEDSILATVFPHSTVPHYVWINQDGVVKAITGMEAVNAGNISAVLADDRIRAVVKSETEELKVDQFDQLFRENFAFADRTGNTGTAYISGNQKYYHSIFSGPLANIHGFLSWDLGNRLTAVNVSPLLLLRDFFGLQTKYDRGMNTFFGPWKTQFEVLDTNIIFAMSGGYLNRLAPDSWTNGNPWIGWANKYAICYEFVAPQNYTEVKRNAMIEQDLQRYFRDIYKVSFAIEQRKIKSLVLRKLPSFKSLGSHSQEIFEDINPFSITLKHKPFADLLIAITGYYRDRYAITDETGIDSKQIVDIELNGKINDYQRLNRELSRYGLKLEVREIRTDVLVIREIDKTGKPLANTTPVSAL